MNELKLYEAINLIDDDLIHEAEQEEWRSSDAYLVRSTSRWHIAVGAAAAAVVAVAVGVIALSHLKISGGLPVDPSVGELSSQGALSGGAVLSSPLVDDNSDSASKPAGEATFLTAPDGTPIYTSEISEVYTGSEEDGSKKTITLAEAEQMAQTGEGGFTIKCDGFVFGYIPERALNRIDNPDMFSEDEYGYFDYLGEVSDIKSGRKMWLPDFIRFKPGDKFGELTVKNAYTIFTRNPRYAKKPAETTYVPGAHISDSCIEFDGALELEGYICVTPMDTNYGEGGDMRFYPDGDSSTKLPSMPFWNKDDQKYYAVSDFGSGGYFGGWDLSLGNMYKVECDTSGLQPGASMVKVKISLDNVRYQMGGWQFDLKSLELI